MTQGPTEPPGNLESATLHPTNRRDDIDHVERVILAALARHAYPESARFAVRLALEEALVNAFMHGHRGLPPETPIAVDYQITPDFVRLAVTDQGPGFKPEAVPDPTLQENLELPSGRGLMLIRSFMTEVHHEANGSRLVMLFRRPDETAEGQAAAQAG